MRPTNEKRFLIDEGRADVAPSFHENEVLSAMDLINDRRVTWLNTNKLPMDKGPRAVKLAIDAAIKRAVRCPHCEDIVIIDCQERQPWKQTYTWTVADQIRHYKGLGFPKMSRRARERQYVQTVCDECVLSQEYDKYYMLRDEVVTEGRPLREVLSSVGVDWSKIDQQSALELW